MISCTEFIPAYSELFAFIEDKYGREAVSAYWRHRFTSTEKVKYPLLEFLEREGIRGCYSYWGGSLNEEAADFTMMLNEKAGWFKIKMHKCPSKGRLLKLKDETGFAPYHSYCLHCDSYRFSLSRVGLEYIYDFDGVDKAACTAFVYDPKVFDGKVVVDENTEIMDRRASDNEYFHRAFHNSLNVGVHYLKETYGVEVLKEFLERFTTRAWSKVIEDAKTRGLVAIEEKIRGTYKAEKCEDAVSITSENGKLNVQVKYSPAIKFFRENGKEVYPEFRYTTETVMDTLAKESGFRFEMELYDEQTGAARYSFC